MRVITVRLSKEHQKLLDEITNILGITRSDSIRYAIQILHKLLTNHSETDLDKLDLIEEILNGSKKIEIIGE